MVTILFKLKQQIVKTICHPYIGRTIAFAFKDHIPNHDCVIVTDDHSITPSVKASLFWRLYESAEIEFVQQYLNPEFDVIELGSSIGVLTSHMARKLATSNRIICVEANPRLLSQIERNVRLNSPTANITILHKAIEYSSISHTSIEFGVRERNIDSKVEINTGESASSYRVQVPIISLSEIIEKSGIGTYTLVSDIEGAEVGMLLSEDKSLQKCRQMIIELHKSRYQGQLFTISDITQLLVNRHGFSLRAKRGAVHLFER